MTIRIRLRRPTVRATYADYYKHQYAGYNRPLAFVLYAIGLIVFAAVIWVCATSR